MSDLKARQRVAKLRRSRKERGMRETNVWVPAVVQEAIDRAVIAGKFPSRRVAITSALERVFTEMEQQT